MIKDKLIQDFLSFSLEANTRSTVHIQDGLKPVHRRVLYDMATLSKATKDYVGSAKIVGDTLGQFHPHGDSSVYNAAVRLAQPFKTRYPLIEFSGNLGSIAQPTGAAHQRYTKMKLSPIGQEVLQFIDKNTVDMVETYNGEGNEPINLPGLFPVALVNGTLGIGVGLASSLPPHNLNEILNAAEYLINNPDASIKSLMNYVKGPDFPTGGQIINPEGLLQAYETGRGSVKIRSNYSIQNKGGKTSIIIEEIPYLIDPETRILGPLHELHEAGYEAIEDIINHTGKGSPFKLEIVLSKGSSVHDVLTKLHKETGIETSFAINNTVYVGNNKFKLLSLKDMLQVYIDNCYNILVKVAVFDLKKAEDRLEIVEGLIKAIVLIEEIIPIIRGSKNSADAATKLQAKWDFTNRQVKAILDMKLSRLTNLDSNKLEEEKNNLLLQINELRAFISNRDLQTQAVVKMYQKFKKNYGDARRTRIQKDVDMAEGEMKTLYFILDEKGFYSLEDIPLSRRNTKGKKLDKIKSIVAAQANETIHIYCEDGTMTPVQAMSLYSSEDNRVTDVTKSPPVGLIKWENKQYLLTLSASGKIKKSPLDEYKEDKFNILCKLVEGDSLQKVWFVDDEDTLVSITDKNKYIAFKVSEVRSTGRLSQGSSITTPQSISADIVREHALFWGEDSKGKLVKLNDLKESSRKSTGLVAGDTQGVIGVCGEAYLCVQDIEGKAIFIKSNSVSAAQPTAQGVAIKNGKIDKILQF